ncbi:hypothetical protein BZA05DRAFT_415086 [Tricharina praecox]|uniref:uncharacterized protein n=1 Tax=Tricharina praecox TaxID=43433 RepID=UPI00221F1526|nr:uncharacterized protein BZA05DRAFT_415086 [Tricharina praecox]KAI5857684.1 hypothetical protein BZA05DRAFT_415086 [Tricharina praecox]
MSRHIPAPEYGPNRKSYKTTMTSAGDIYNSIITGNKSVVVNNYNLGASQNAAVTMGASNYSYMQPPQPMYGQQQMTYPQAAIAPAPGFPMIAGVDCQMVAANHNGSDDSLIIRVPQPHPQLFYPQLAAPHVATHYEHHAEGERSHGQHHDHRSPDEPFVKYCKCNKGHTHVHPSGSTPTHNSSPPSEHMAGRYVFNQPVWPANAYAPGVTFQPAYNAFGVPPAPIAYPYQLPRIEQALGSPPIIHHQSSPILQPTAPVIAQPLDQTAVPRTSPNGSRHIPINNDAWNQTPTPIKEASDHHNSGNSGWNQVPPPTKAESVRSNNNGWNQVPSPTKGESARHTPSNNGWNNTPAPTKEASIHVHQRSPIKDSNSGGGGGWGSNSNSPATPPSVHGGWGASSPPESVKNAGSERGHASSSSRHNPQPSASQDATKSSSKGKGKKPAWNADGPEKPEPRAQKKSWDNRNDE